MDVTDGAREIVGVSEIATQPRVSLLEIVKTSEHILAQHLARRYSTKDLVKSVKRRAEKLLEQEDGKAFDEEFAKVVTTANEVFDQVINQAEAGHA